MNVRRALAGTWAILPLAAVLLTVTLLPAPERVPTHWSTTSPDGFATGPGFSSAVLTATVLTAVLAAGTAVLQRAVPQAWSRWLLAVLAAVGWGAWLVHVVIVWRARMDGPEGVAAGWPLVAILGSLLAAAVGYVVHGRRSPTPQQLADMVPDRARARPIRGRAVRQVEPWSTELTSRTLQVIAWVVLAAFLVVLVVVVVQEGGGPVAWAMGLVLAVVGVGTWLLAYAWSAVRVDVDADGLRIRSRALPLRLSRVPVEEIAGVDAQQLDAMRWGGIGLRALPDRTAYIVQAQAPGIVVYKRDGRRLALQVTEGDQVARDGARTLLQAAGQRLGEASPTTGS